ncbi:MAG TPA: citramalate synthase [Bryobacteraceae bacterium]|nr:citramalate synthase [Bryobacteraceae bacterium]
MRIFTLDTTLRAGALGDGASFSIEEKLLIAQKLDALGIDYIEGGWGSPGTRDEEFFRRARNLRFRHAHLTAFGCVRGAWTPVENDSAVRCLVVAGTPTVTLGASCWGLHVLEALRMTEKENLRVISETVRFLKAQGREVILDAEHFFDGYRANTGFAMRTLEAAKSAGADVLCLCDSNGETVTELLAEICTEVRKRFDGVLGIQTHNDADLAVASTLAAIDRGFTHVQGSMNGYGERCGNANLCSLIPDLELKLGHTTVGRENLHHLTAVARLVADYANLPMRSDQPYVGRSAFLREAGCQLGTVLKDPVTSERTQPEDVGNRARVVWDDLSDTGSIFHLLGLSRLAGVLTSQAQREFLDRVQEMERDGYELETAGGTLELLARQAAEPGLRFFDLAGFEVTTKMTSRAQTVTTAKVTVQVQNASYSATAKGTGPLHALDLCLRAALATFYPQIAGVRLTDYRVRVLEPNKGTAAKVRVAIEWAGGHRRWVTAGVSENVIEASWRALVDAIRLELMRLNEQQHGTLAEALVEDYSWGV